MLQTLPVSMTILPQPHRLGGFRGLDARCAGDEHRGVKQVHGKCISCDRPLKIVRDNRLAPGPPTMDAFGPGAPGSANAPGWEAGSKRALGNGAMETYWELMCGPNVTSVSIESATHLLYALVNVPIWIEHRKYIREITRVRHCRVCTRAHSLA